MAAWRVFILGAVVCSLAAGQTPRPAERAYEALRALDYDRAIPLFHEAIQAAPANAGLRKDLAYTYLKAGETEAARDQFAEAMRLDPADDHIALEYGYLCFETKKQAEARRVFDRVRKTGGPQAAAAEQAFQNVDRPLAEGIARWSAVVAQSPENFSAHAELARLAAQRDALELAAEHYLAAWRLRQGERDLLLEAGRAWRALGREPEAIAALLAASRGSSPRVAEQARELLPSRPPSIVELRGAAELDPKNLALRRELAAALLQGNETAEAERELRVITSEAPQDIAAAAELGLVLLERQDRAGAMALFDRVLKSDDDELIARVREALRMPAELRRRTVPQRPAPAPEPAPAPPSPAESKDVAAKEMGDRSYRAGYLQDARRYFEAAHEADPLDFSVMLRLGWTFNALHQDDRALGWFDLARRSPDPGVASEANRAWHNLHTAFAPWRTTVWAFPFYSSRWRDLFSYAQVKTDLRLGRLPVRPYISMRFIGDSRGAIGESVPQYLSESSFLVALGAATSSWHGVMAWAEAGSAIRYTGSRDRGRMVPDYRGGVAFVRGAGRLLGAEAPGLFAETHDDGVFVSRFGNNFLIYSQNQAGYTLPPFGALRLQVYWNNNITIDTKRERWANFVESGPGLRMRLPLLPESVVFSANLLRGMYLINDGQSSQTFSDARVGFWYAFTH